MYKEFIKCNHGYSNVESVYDFLPLYCYNDDINKKIKNVDIKKENKEFEIILKLIAIVFTDMYKEKDLIEQALNNIDIHFCDVINEKNKTDIMGKYMPRMYNDDKTYSNEYIVIANRINNDNIPRISKLLNLIHELRHHIVSLKNNYIYEDDLFYQRIGFSEKVKQNNLIYSFGTLLDELYNEYISEILINNIMSMKHLTIDDSEVKKVLYSFRNPEEKGYYKNLAYYEDMYLLHPILRCNDVTNQINMLTFQGEIEQVKQIFSDTFKINYYEFAKNLEINKEYVKEKIYKMERNANEINNI